MAPQSGGHRFKSSCRGLKDDSQVCGICYQSHHVMDVWRLQHLPLLSKRVPLHEPAKQWAKNENFAHVESALAAAPES